MQSPMLIHFAITPDKIQAFESCLFGVPTIRLRDKTTGAEWWGASASWYLETELTDDMGQRKACLATFSAWYSVAAYKLRTGTVDGEPAYTEYNPPVAIESNCGLPHGVPDPGFDAFLAACNLERWPETGDNGNISLFGGGGMGNGTLTP